MQPDVADRPAEPVTTVPVLTPVLPSSAAAPAPAGAGRASSGLRLRGALLLAPCAAVICVAACLTPRQAGYGTHQQLGLPPCSFLWRTGYPCPSCGLTTAFAAMAHGRPGEALRDHPFGPVLFLAAAAMGLCGLAELAGGRDALHLLRPGAWWAVAALAGLLAGWGVKIAMGLANGSLPVR